ncbi:MAG TPA: 3-isopropylmalate dehydratase small subunit [Ramlibacter sp.]|uniref:3-isopropylmalate dehydratase small subunit n=1 Tax=Ramlibacter sp. TaxID=1917967 RepID=UPI002ED5B36E
MEPFRSVTGAAAPLPQDDVNTDQIIPSAWLKDLNADMAEGFLAYMRRRPDGTSISDFVLERPQYAGAPILVTGQNFGCGSSREHAVWSMRAFGVRCVIGESPAEFFRDNCLKNGVLPVTLDAERMRQVRERVQAVDGLEPFTVDLEACQIRGPGGFVMPFEIAAGEREALLEGLDEIGMTLKSLGAIEAWEERATQLRPFLQAAIRKA